MQHRNWDDLKYLLAVQRAGTLAGAARRLHVDPTTASRRINQLQSSATGALIERDPDGSLRLTGEGERVARHAEAMERHARLIERHPEEDSGCIGTVRLTSVPIVANRILLASMSGLLDAHPALQIELIPDSRDYSLTRREADLAVRLSRPKTGGTQVKARRIANLDYAAYAPKSVRAHDRTSMPWITFDDAMAHVPQAQWVARQSRGQQNAIANLRVRDGETALEAAASGLGKTLLPRCVGDRDNRLFRLDRHGEPALSREVWLLGHAALMNRDYIKATIRWIEDTFARLAD